jgi:glutathione S-transferase
MTSLHESGKYLVYGYSLSYFSRKLEAAMDWYGLDYEFRIKAPELKTELEKRSGSHQVPILVTPQDECFADTTPILWMMDERYPERRMFPDGPLGALVQILEEYLDEWLPRIVMHYRWQFDECTRFAAEALGMEAAPQAHALVGTMLTQWGKKVCRALGVTDEAMKREAEAEWVRLLDHLEAQLGETAYALGDRPCAVDAVLLGGLRGHFRPDPVPNRVLQSYPRVCRWIDTAADWKGEGQLAPFPSSTPFAQFLLEEMSGNYRVYALANAQALAANEKAFVCETYGQPISYKARRYTEKSRGWIVDRIHDQLGSEDYAAFLTLLSRWNLEAVFAHPPQP